MADIRAPLSALDQGAEAEETAAPALPPMPKRVADDSLRALPPEEGVAKLLARARRLAEQLEEDVAELTADQQRERQRIEEEWHQLEHDHKEAVGRLAEMTAKARRIAENKARVAEFEHALTSRPLHDGSGEFSALADEIDRELRAARGITGTIRLPRIGSLLAQAALAIDQLSASAEETRQQLLSQTDDHMQSEGTEARASFDIGLMVLERDLATLTEALPLPARPWTDPGWPTWAPPEESSSWVRIGGYVHETLPSAGIPALLSIGNEPGLLIETGGHRDEAIAGLQSLLLRIVAAHPAGAVRFTLVDPNGLGESVAPLLALGEHDPSLIDGSVRTLEAEIEDGLAGLVRHIERVTQHHLQGRFDTLADFHLAVGERVEPTRFLIVVDHPSGLSERAVTLVRTIAETGMRAGVQTVVVRDPKPASRSKAARMVPELRVVRAKNDGLYLDTADGLWQVELDQLPSPDRGGIVERITREAGSRARAEARRPLDHARLFATVDQARRRGAATDLPDSDTPLIPSDRSTWWQADAGDRIAVPIGRTAEREPITVGFDDHHPAVLVAGGPDSGIPALLDAFVTGAAMLYAPTELQLLLVALGGRDTFAAYGEGALPHARLVGNDADPELAHSALETLAAELDRRIDRFREAGCERQGLAAYRARSGRATSRIVLAIDAVGELTSADDAIADHARRLLGRLAFEGPPVGLHLLLTQHLRATVAGSVAAVAPVLDQVGDRFLLQCEPRELEALATGTTFDEVRRAELERAGDAVLARTDNPSKSLRLVAIDRHERTSCVREVRHLADERGVVAVPQVHVGSTPSLLEHAPFGLLAATVKPDDRDRPPSLWLGEPVGIGPPVDLPLHRRPGANVVVVSEEDTGHGVMAASVFSAAISRSGHVEVHVVDLGPIETGLGRTIGDLHDAIDGFSLSRPAGIDRALAHVEQIVGTRSSKQVADPTPVLLVVHGLHRLDDTRILARLGRLLRDGPTVGVHVLTWCDSPAALLERLPDAARSEIGVRLVAAMSPGHSRELIESDQATDLRGHHALLYDASRGRLTKLRPYARPPAGWRPPAGSAT
jgi:DNA segregation ATPase FtsK/SpoIIIE, S-DNA-T family